MHLVKQQFHFILFTQVWALLSSRVFHRTIPGKLPSKFTVSVKDIPIDYGYAIQMTRCIILQIMCYGKSILRAPILIYEKRNKSCWCFSASRVNFSWNSELYVDACFWSFTQV